VPAQDGLLRGLFDDASLFPPASLGMADAVTGHFRHQAAWYREMSGPFVCPDAKIAQLAAVMTAASVVQLDLALVLPGGAAALPAGVDAVLAEPRLRLRAVEVPVARHGEPGGAADSRAAAAELAAALDGTPLPGARAFIEIPPGDLTADALRVVADHGYLAKLRTGGVTAEAFPDEPTLARCLTALADRRLPFKCTAGLHHAVRHTADDTGFEHHGFLNVLLGVAVALDGGSAEEVASVLADRDAPSVAAAVARLDADAAAAARGLFTSFGTCSTDEPVTDLVTLGLVGVG
jgi:hypothetical protein